MEYSNTTTADLTVNALAPLVQEAREGMLKEHGAHDLGEVPDWYAEVGQRVLDASGATWITYDDLAGLIADVSQLGPQITAQRCTYAVDVAAVGPLILVLVRVGRGRDSEPVMLCTMMSKATTEAQLAGQVHAVLAAAGTSDDGHIDPVRMVRS